MFEIETTRLRLLPLTHAQLLLLRNGFEALEDELGMKHCPFRLNADPEFTQEFFEAIQHHTIPAVTAHPEHYSWYTHWAIISCADHLIVGGIGATGLPDENGETTIGYFINGDFEGRGFATEAVTALVNWIFFHPEAHKVIAFTEHNSNASTRVLSKNDFVADGEVEGGYKWFRKK